MKIEAEKENGGWWCASSRYAKSRKRPVTRATVTQFGQIHANYFYFYF